MTKILKTPIYIPVSGILIALYVKFYLSDKIFSKENKTRNANITSIVIFIISVGIFFKISPGKKNDNLLTQFERPSIDAQIIANQT